MELENPSEGNSSITSRDAILIARNDPGIQQLLQQDVPMFLFEF